MKGKNSFLQGVVCILAVYVSFSPWHIEEGGVCRTPERNFFKNLKKAWSFRKT